MKIHWLAVVGGVVVGYILANWLANSSTSST